MEQKIISLLKEELKLTTSQAENCYKLFDDGATVPFVARYRKELTSNMDEVQLDDFLERLKYYTELFKRKDTIIKTITEAGKMTDELKKQIEDSNSKTEIEDLYLPYKPKRKTRASSARDKGLDPLALDLIKQEKTLEEYKKEAKDRYLNEKWDLTDVDEAMAGVHDILAEVISERPESRAFVREKMYKQGFFSTTVKKDYLEQKTKYEMYYNYKSKVSDIPSHNMLAIKRAEKEGIINYSLDIDPEELYNYLAGKEIICPAGTTLYAFMEDVVKDAYERLMKISLTAEIRVEKKKEADVDAILNFEKNLKELLLSSPAGKKSVMGIDPGIRTGSKVIVVDENGKYLDNNVIYTDRKKDAAQKLILEYVKKYSIELIAVGNGTGGRETEKFVREVLKNAGHDSIACILVNESGASIYSASKVARDEFPNLDLTVRGAISIARRLQDPLAELVKIDPKSIGVGQYQHDVDQTMLNDKLQHVVESCVNYVGVNLNTSSAMLLSFVAGITSTAAKNIVAYRDTNGAFKNREELKKVKSFGAKSFEQAAGFLKISDGDNPLDNSAVHPESYYIVENIAKATSVGVKEIVSNENALKGVKARDFVDEKIGIYTVDDIIDELKKPGRDPRKEFSYAKFRDDVNQIKDLEMGMMLEGVVTNVTNFGAFVDIGVHQDGLVHLSQLSSVKFVNDPLDVVSVGETVKVKVLEVDIELKRISLTMKLDEVRQAPKQKDNKENPRKQNNNFKGNKGRGHNANKPSFKKEEKHTSLGDLMNMFKPLDTKKENKKNKK